MSGNPIAESVSDWGCHASQVSLARRWLHDVLSDGDTDQTPWASEHVYDGELILSELLTNAIQAGCSGLSVSVIAGATSIRIGVTDDASGTPVLRNAAPTQASGRGLPIVAALSDEWGVRRRGPRKEVWAKLAVA